MKYRKKAKINYIREGASWIHPRLDGIGWAVSIGISGKSK